MKIYEHIPQELDEVLAFRNAIFGYISKEHWQAMNCTAVVAREGDQLIGFIPLQFRQQCLNARVTIPVVYENAVGVAEGMRGRGIGTQMLDEAARFISDRVDAMMVIRGGERTKGYRFYRKSGHGDVSYGRRYVLASSAEHVPSHRPGETALSADRGDIVVLDRDRWVALEPRTLALYQQQYGRFGGGQKRSPGYWDMILDSHVHRERKWWLVVLSRQAHLAGYLVAVHGSPWSDGPGQSAGVHIYEVVGENESAIERLIWYARGLEGETVGAVFSRPEEKQSVVVPNVSLANPVCPVLRRMGFVEQESTSHIMARVLRPERIFRQLAAGSDLLRTLSLTVVTPHRTLVVNDPPESRYAVQIETKESTLSRLFCCRLNLEAAVEIELVRWNAYDPGLRRALEQVFAFSAWVQWYTDYA